MRIKILYITALLTILSAKLIAQTGVGKVVVNPSAILDISNSTNKSFLAARVSLGGLLDNTNPVANPAEGLIVYNTGAVQIKGFYIWNKGMWSLLASKGNSVTNSVVSKLTSTTGVLAGKAANSFEPITNNTLSFNGISDLTYSAASGGITVPAGSYNIQVSLNVEASDEIPGSGIGNAKRTHAHYYVAKLLSGALELGGIMNDNTTSNSSATTNAKQHTANFSFTFQVLTTTTFVFNLAHASGGTYANGVGGAGPNNGQITILNSFIHIQRSEL